MTQLNISITSEIKKNCAQQKLIRHSRNSGFGMTRNSKFGNIFSNQKYSKKAATAHSQTVMQNATDQ